MPQPNRKRYAQVAPPAASQSISAYARVSKSSAPRGPSASKGVALAADGAATRKRKAVSIEVQIPCRTVSFAPSSDEDGAAPVPRKRPCRQPESRISSAASAKPPPKGRCIAALPPSKARGPHKPSQSTTIPQSRHQAQPKINATPQSKKRANDKHEPSEEALPSHLADLVCLNKAFLKTIMLHMAHAGSSVPIDIRAIATNLSRTWGKRQVTIEDIRRCLAIQAFSADSDKAHTFIISDYGRGKVCVELAPGLDGASVSEGRLIRQFRENLRAFCTERALDDMADVGETLQSMSLDDIPKAAITDMGAAAKANPMLVKGRRALSELKSDREAKQKDKEAQKQAVINNQMLNPDGTKMSLLDRVRAKQLIKANEPLAPAGPELQRRAALNRVGDVAATISMLSLSNPLSLPRQAFTMLAISEKLKDSLRVPLSTEEGMACVRLIATEVAPEWLRVVKIGGRENVVVQRNGQPVDRVIHERVQKLMT